MVMTQLIRRSILLLHMSVLQSSGQSSKGFIVVIYDSGVVLNAYL